MASAQATIDLDVPPDDVWKLIGGFGSLPDWIPYISRSELTDGGRVRHLDNSDGQTIVERLEKYDSSARTYSYSILQSPFPVADYLATITVTSINAGEGSLVEWSGTFTPNGVSDDEVHSLFQGIFSDGLKALWPFGMPARNSDREELVSPGFTRPAADRYLVHQRRDGRPDGWLGFGTQRQDNHANCIRPGHPGTEGTSDMLPGDIASTLGKESGFDRLGHVVTSPLGRSFSPPRRRVTARISVRAQSDKSLTDVPTNVKQSPSRRRL